MLFPIVTFGQWGQLGNTLEGDLEDDLFGNGLSINAAGTRIAVGATKPDETGAVKVFDFDDDIGVWEQIGDEIVGENPEDFFGIRLRLNAEGNILAIGALGNDGNGPDSGSVKVYNYDGNNWVQLGATLMGDTDDEWFGYNVSLSDDGTILAVGSPRKDSNGEDSGSVFVYKFEANNWISFGNELIGDAEGDWFGSDIDINGDGTSLIIGASFNDVNGDSAGQAKVFQINANTWEQVGDDFFGDDLDDWFGVGVKISNDGNIIGIGAYSDVNGNNSGSVRVFQNVANNWVQMGADFIGENENDLFGRFFDFNLAGNIIAIGAHGFDENENGSGQVKLYEFITDNWVLIGEPINGENASDFSGVGLALNASGNTVAIGATYFNGQNGSNTGQARVFKNPNILGNNDIVFENEISVFPNPVSEYLTISNPNNTQLETAFLYDITGRLVQTFNLSEINSDNVINLNSISKGIYLLKLIGEQTNITKRIIKK